MYWFKLLFEPSWLYTKLAILILIFDLEMTQLIIKKLPYDVKENPVRRNTFRSNLTT